MRILEFNVEKQQLTKKSDCDFSGLVAGSMGYLKAKFYFSKEWDRCATKVASFWERNEEHAAILDADNTCLIPHEALVSGKFYVSAIGASDTYRLATNRTKVVQEVTRYGNR